MRMVKSLCPKEAVEPGIETLIAHGCAVTEQDQWLLEAVIQQERLVLVCWISCGLAAQGRRSFR